MTNKNLQPTDSITSGTMWFNDSLPDMALFPKTKDYPHFDQNLITGTEAVNVGGGANTVSSFTVNMTTPINLSGSQVSSIALGIKTLFQYLSLAGDKQVFQTEIAGLSKSMASMVNVGAELNDGLSTLLTTLLDGPMNVSAVIAAIFQAANEGGLMISTIQDSMETTAGHQILWLDIGLSDERTTTNVQFDLDHSTTETQRLHSNAFGVDVRTGLIGGFRIGIDLTPGLSPEQAVLLASDHIEVYAKVATIVQDVEAAYGILGLGPTDVAVNLDAHIDIDLQEGALGYMTLGELKNGTVDSQFDLQTGGTGFKATVPFTLDIDGFRQTGATVTIDVAAQDSFNPAAQTITLPALTLDDGSAFDFNHFTEIQLADLGAYLLQLKNQLPSLGDGFKIPVLEKDIGNLVDLGSKFHDLLAALQNPDGTWSFDNIQSLIHGIADYFGVTEASLGLRWESQTNALEWDVPFDISSDQSVTFDANNISPNSSGIVINGTANGGIQADLDVKLTGGVAVNSSVNITPVTLETLLSDLNGGLGLTTKSLLSGASPIDDIRVQLRDGTVSGFDLNTVAGLGDGTDRGTATVGDLLSQLNKSSKLTIELRNNQLVLTDNTQGMGSFTVITPSAYITLGTGTEAVTVQSASFAPILLGIAGVSAVADPMTGKAVVTGNSLASQSLLDRLYIKEQSIVSGKIHLDASVEGGAVLGPVSLNIVYGQLQGDTGWTVGLQDPGIGANNDGRIYLSELSGLQIESLLNHQLDTQAWKGFSSCKSLLMSYSLLWASIQPITKAIPWITIPIPI